MVGAADRERHGHIQTRTARARVPSLMRTLLSSDGAVVGSTALFEKVKALRAMNRRSAPCFCAGTPATLPRPRARERRRAAIRNGEGDVDGRDLVERDRAGVVVVRLTRLRPEIWRVTVRPSIGERIFRSRRVAMAFCTEAGLPRPTWARAALGAGAEFVVLFGRGTVKPFSPDPHTAWPRHKHSALRSSRDRFRFRPARAWPIGKGSIARGVTFGTYSPSRNQTR